MENHGVVYPPVPLKLSPEDERSIEMIADRLVAETLHASEDFAAQGHVADPSCWKRIKEKDNIVAYQDISNPRTAARERVWSEDTVVVTASPQNPTFYSTSNRSLQDALLNEGFHNIDDYDSEDERGLHHDAFTKFGAKAGADIGVLEKFRPANVPTVFSHGVFPGTVEDMALAFLADTDARSHMRFSTNKEQVVEDTRILAQIRGPTKDDPFRFLGVKWCTNMPSRTVSLVVKPRDYLIIESTGMALDSNGERFTYLLNHSIELDEVPNFRDFGLVRITYSACHIMKPHDNGEAVEEYARGFLVVGGSFSVRVGVIQFAEGIVAIPRVLEEAFLKKLAWMMHDQHRWSTSSSNSSETSSSFSSSSGTKSLLEKTSSCPCCHGKLSSRRLGSFMEKSSGCRLCRRAVCHKCTIKKMLPVEGARGRHMKKKEREFCLDCYLKAKRLPAWNVAVATLSKASP
ncbi:hypothetical protein PHYPSEUDO_009061 [Phytophthora pseudosyringae]|uniref:FYVE-type domain-containing protein n=1 Tax=Phytophthora pseudosyringae TaxID=221518 RepID=A0A8T1VI76_9STRA|nr:hypothetical protein PHYPSEUDO_009061 [Phytophthora pseudosyringae]